MNMLDDLQKLQYLQSMLSQQGPMSPAQMPGMAAMGGMMPSPDMQPVNRTPDFAPGGGAPQHHMPHPHHKPISPLQAGSRDAVEAAKRSLGMTDDEHRKAMGRALVNFSSGMSQHRGAPGTGIAGALGMINAGFAPAINAYDAERDRVAQLNYQLQQAQKMEADSERKYQLELKKHQDELEIQRGLLGLKKEELKHRQGELGLNERQLIAEGVTPLSSLKTGPERRQADTVMRKHIESGKHYKEVLHDTDVILDILDRNPDIMKKPGTFWMAAQSDNPAVWRQALFNAGIPEPEQEDAFMLLKTLNSFSFEKMTSLPSHVKGNMLLERLIKNSTPNIAAPAGAIRKMALHDRQIALDGYEDSKKVSDYRARGGFYDPPLREYQSSIPSSVDKSAAPVDEKQRKVQQLLQEYANAPD